QRDNLVRGQAGEQRNTRELLGGALRVSAGRDIGRHCAADYRTRSRLTRARYAPRGSMGRWLTRERRAAPMHLEQAVRIDRPAAEVFDFLLDLGNHPRVAAGIRAVRGIEDGPLALGRRYSQTSTILGQTVDVAVEVISCERGRELGLKSVSGLLP